MTSLMHLRPVSRRKNTGQSSAGRNMAAITKRPIAASNQENFNAAVTLGTLILINVRRAVFADLHREFCAIGRNSNANELAARLRPCWRSTRGSVLSSSPVAALR